MSREEDDDAAIEMNSAKFKIAIEFSERMLHDQMVAAIEGGSNYWATIKVGKRQPGWRNYFTAEFTIHEVSDEKHGAIHGKTYEMSVEKLKAGLLVLHKKYPQHFCSIVEENGDAWTGDALVQCALFGHCVYG